MKISKQYFIITSIKRLTSLLRSRLTGCHGVGEAFFKRLTSLPRSRLTGCHGVGEAFFKRLTSLLRSRLTGCHGVGEALRDMPKDGCEGDWHVLHAWWFLLRWSWRKVSRSTNNGGEFGQRSPERYRDSKSLRKTHWHCAAAVICIWTLNLLTTTLKSYSNLNSCS